MKKIVVVIPHSHTWFWTQTCLSSILRHPPKAEGYEVEVVVVNNSPWSPAIKGLTCTDLMRQISLRSSIRTLENYKSNKFHASALDCVVEKFDFDYLMTLETDVLITHPNWLQWFIDQIKPSDFAVGMWHHEHFINPSCTLYNGKALKDMSEWCKGKTYIKSDIGGESVRVIGSVPEDRLRWGLDFTLEAPLDNSLTPGVLNDPRELQIAIDNFKEWVAGPFAEKRGFPHGTMLKESPSGQMKGPGWYEPGQQLHAWAVQTGYTYTVCSTMTTCRSDNLPLQTLYGSVMPDPQRQLDAVEMFGNAHTVHLWGGTRALDIIKHDVKCEFVRSNTPMWLAREARFWKQVVPQGVQDQTLELIRHHGWHITGQGNNHVSDRDRNAAEYVRECYKLGGVEW